MVSSKQVIGLSFVIHLGLILYAHHVDTHPEQFGGLKYTDVDWRVVSDGAALIFRDGQDRPAQGWLTRLLGLSIGDPYNRATFRYTPLLPLVLSPTLIHPLLGKAVLALLSLCVTPILLSDPSSSFWAVHLLWTLNPFVLNITTRGSPEAIIVFLVVATLACLRKADNIRARPVPPEGHKVTPLMCEDIAGTFLALSISWKIYPVIYVPAIWAHLARSYGWFGEGVWRFGIGVAVRLAVINGLLWSIWGQPFLEHTFRYHLSRLDHRHNFSAYFYPIYLSFFRDTTGEIPKIASAGLALLDKLVQHPLSSFIPQFGFVTLAGLLITPRAGLDLAVFVQTAGFVIFNKVCTSQYFIWFIPLIPPLLSHLRMSRRKACVMLGLWVAAQAFWLGTAYRLEFLAQGVHLQLWVAGVGLLFVSTWVLGEIIGSYTPQREASQGSSQEKEAS